MKSFYYDELNENEVKKIEEYLDDQIVSSNISGLYWLYLPNEILFGDDRFKIDNNILYKVAIELGDSWFKIELLIRPDDFDGGQCFQANSIQLQWLDNWANMVLKKFSINSCL